MAVVLILPEHRGSAGGRGGEGEGREEGEKITRE